MSHAENRLADCFPVLFPDLSRERITALNLDPTEGSGSLTGVTLVTVTQQDLHADVDPADLEHLSSFPATLTIDTAVRGHSGGDQVTEHAH
jgi:hypothetical protein